MAYSKIIHTKSEVVGVAPTRDSLSFGEIAINYSDGFMYIKKADGDIHKVAATDHDGKIARLLTDVSELDDRITYVNNRFTEAALAIFGRGNVNTDTNTVVLGIGNTIEAGGELGTVVGKTNISSGSESIIFGNENTVSAPKGIAIGYSSDVSGENGIAIGKDAEASASNSIQLGIGTNNTPDTIQFKGSGPVTATQFGYLNSTLSQIGGLINSVDGTLIVANGSSWTAVPQLDLPVSTATQTAIDTAITNLVDTAPGALDTLNELAAAIGDDPAFFTTINDTRQVALESTEADYFYTAKTINPVSETYYSVSVTDDRNFQIVSDLFSDGVGISKNLVIKAAFDATDPLRLGTNKVTFNCTLNSGAITNNRFRLRYRDISETPGEPNYGDFQIVEGANSFTFDVFDNGGSPDPQVSFLSGAVSQFDVSITDLKITSLSDINVKTQTALDLKADQSTTYTKAEVDAGLQIRAPIASPTFTGTVGGITPAMVQLGNVDNTSDANKPVSTATQTALDLKEEKAIPIATLAALYALTGLVGGERYRLTDTGQIYEYKGGGESLQTSWRLELTSDDTGTFGAQLLTKETKLQAQDLLTVPLPLAAFVHTLTQHEWRKAFKFTSTASAAVGMFLRSSTGYARFLNHDGSWGAVQGNGNPQANMQPQFTAAGDNITRFYAAIPCDVSGNLAGDLTKITVSSQKVTAVDVTGLGELTELALPYNLITSFDGTGLRSLTQLILWSNQLVSFDGTDLVSLTQLYLSNNNLTSFSGKGLGLLTLLYLASNNLTSFDSRGLGSVTTLKLERNNLTSFDSRGLGSVTTLEIWDNLLVTMDVSESPALSDLRCWNNPLPALDLSSNPAVIYLIASGCQLVEVTHSPAPRSWGLYSSIDVSGSLLTEGALNDMFSTLPTGLPYPIVLDISGNPGAATADQGLIVDSNWSVLT